MNDNRPKLDLAEQAMIETISANGLIFTAEAVQAMREQTLPGHEFKSTAVQVGPDQYFIPLSISTMKRLRAAAFANETPSDVFLRIVAKRKGLN